MEEEEEEAAEEEDGGLAIVVIHAPADSIHAALSLPCVAALQLLPDVGPSTPHPLPWYCSLYTTTAGK